MSDINGWIIAVIALCSAMLVGKIAGRLAQGSIARSNAGRDLAEFGPAISRVIAACAFTVGLVIAVAALDSESFGRLPDRMLDIIPNGVVAAVIASCGYALSVAAAASIATASVQTTGRRHRLLERLVRFAVMSVTAVLVLSALGVDPIVLAMALALFAGVPLIAACALTATGGSDVARNIAAGRALRAHLRPRHRLSVGDLDGVIVAVHNVSLELQTDRGGVVHVPLRRLLDEPFSIDPSLGSHGRSGPESAAGSGGPRSER